MSIFDDQSVLDKAYGFYSRFYGRCNILIVMQDMALLRSYLYVRILFRAWFFILIILLHVSTSHMHYVIIIT